MKRPQERIGLTIAATLVAIEVAAVAFFIVVAAALVCNDHPQDGCVP